MRAKRMSLYLTYFFLQQKKKEENI